MKIKALLNNLNLLIFIVVTILSFNAIAQNTDFTTESEPDRFKRLDWWSKEKGGLFLDISLQPDDNSGKYTINYDTKLQATTNNFANDLSKWAMSFNPKQFNADEIAAYAGRMGLKFIVLPVKNATGLCMWNSSVSDFDVVDATPYKIDILKEMSDACKKYNLKFGVYFSLSDLHHPDCNSKGFVRYREKYVVPLVKEILTQYGTIDYFVFDASNVNEWTKDQSKYMYNIIRNLQKNIVVSKSINAIGDANKNTYGDVYTTNAPYNTDTLVGRMDSYHLDNQELPTVANYTFSQFLSLHFQNCQKNNNFQYVVNIDAKGDLSQETVNIIAAYNFWLKTNREALSNTTAWIHPTESNNVYYFSDKDWIYAIVRYNPNVNTIYLKSVKPISNSLVYLLGESEPLPYTFENKMGLKLDLPAKFTDSATVKMPFFVLKMKGNEVRNAAAPKFFYNGFEVKDTVVFFDNMSLRLTSETQDAKIYFNMTGGEITPTSPIIESPITFFKTSTIKAMAVSDSMVSSEIVQLHCEKSRFDKTTYAHKYDNTKDGGGVLALMDRKYGTLSAIDERWQGFKDVDFDFQGEIRLLPNKFYNVISINFLEDQGGQAFLPTDVKISISEDGITYNELKTDFVAPSLKQNNQPRVMTVTATTPTTIQKLKSIKIFAKNAINSPDFNKDKNSHSWIMIDEIEFH
ncbi:MAG: alpha-L-fucosidase [Saprospiraceae bacterium]|nr:alpha-L-fucosidase [Saprospiraceae bacterium]